MRTKLESSDYSTNRIELEPRLLLCLNCLRGGAGDGIPDCARVRQLADQIKANPDLHVTLVGAFDEIGAKTDRFAQQSPAERRKDLHVLQHLGLCFGDTRTARDLLFRIHSRITSLEGICAYPDRPYKTWPECPHARTEAYQRGNRPLPWPQAPEVMAVYKQESTQQLAAADHIHIRPHHLLCVVCHAGRPNGNEPLAEDNLLEAKICFQQNPDIPVTLVEGPSDCCICPPCHAMLQSRGLCVAACHLRDRKKDLDTCAALGVSPGETYTARELYRRIRRCIPDVKRICAFASDYSPEWTSCGSAKEPCFQKGLAEFDFDA